MLNPPKATVLKKGFLYDVYLEKVSNKVTELTNSPQFEKWAMLPHENVDTHSKSKLINLYFVIFPV